jgi:CRISPR system Cascade subunit CasA
MLLEKTAFNLVQECWIPVVGVDWRQQEISLVELFQTWATYREIQADNPPTTLALYRFLLAILHRAYQGPRDEAHWEQIRDDDGKKAIAYLRENQDCFDLLHPERPFMQDSVLAEDKAVPIYAIHTMSTSKVFSHEHEWSGYRISQSEAARLLVRLQSVDITSLRAFYPPHTKGNRSAVNTPTINAANVLVQGKSLKETLLFNLVKYNPLQEAPSVVRGQDLPTWEIGYSGQPEKAIPCGYIHYLAYPWRRVNLFWDGNYSQRIAITMGNSLPDGIIPKQWECNVAFQEGKPVRLLHERQLWRDSHCFLQSAEQDHRPIIIDWIAELSDADLVDDVVHLQIFGMCANQAKPLGWSIEKFSIPKEYITIKELGQALRTAISTAENHQEVFRSSQGSPYHSLAKELNHPDALSFAKSLDGESRYWATLDREFQPLLVKLAANITIDGNGTIYGNQVLPDWLATVQKAAKKAFTESIACIRNYQARAVALRSLEWKLADLRMTPEEKAAKKAKAKAKKKEKVFN